MSAAQPDACRGDVVVVLDADARIGPAFLGRLAAYVRAGAGALTARRRMLDAGSGWLAGAQADEQTLDGEIQRGRWSLGGCSEFRGNGIVVRRDLLASVGGWRPEALTEDLDLSSRLAAAHGTAVAWAIDAEVWEEPVRSLGGLWRQRLRWAEGGLRRVLEHGPAVVTSPALGRYARLDFATYAGQLAIPPVILGTLAGAVVRGVRRPRRSSSGRTSRRAARWPGTRSAGSPDRRPGARTGRTAPSLGPGRAVQRGVAGGHPGRAAAPGDASRPGRVRQDGPRRRRARGVGRLRRVAVVFTGGTISMLVDPVAGGAVPALDGAAILARTPGLDRLADARADRPGPHACLALDVPRAARHRAGRSAICRPTRRSTGSSSSRGPTRSTSRASCSTWCSTRRSRLSSPGP